MVFLGTLADVDVAGAERHELDHRCRWSSSDVVVRSRWSRFGPRLGSVVGTKSSRNLVPSVGRTLISSPDSSPTSQRSASAQNRAERERVVGIEAEVDEAQAHAAGASQPRLADRRRLRGSGGVDRVRRRPTAWPPPNAAGVSGWRSSAGP